jgi:hypothetical protein
MHELQTCRESTNLSLLEHFLDQRRSTANFELESEREDFCTSRCKIVALENVAKNYIYT